MNSEPSDDSIIFPLVGELVEPDLAAGKFGNGSWNLTDGSIEEAHAAVHEARKANRDERERLFHEEAKDALRESIDYHRRIVRMGDAVLDKIEAGAAVPSRAEMSVLGQAKYSSSWLADRGIGKPKQISEHTESKSILGALLIRKESHDAG